MVKRIKKIEYAIFLGGIIIFLIIAYHYFYFFLKNISVSQEKQIEKKNKTWFLAVRG
ncbi:MAG: hypothetical protein V1860_01795 [bacterium]